MKVTSERQDGQVVLTVEIEPERVEKAKDAAVRRLANRYTIPGFRKGKAPRAMLERYLGPAAILDDAIQQLVPNCAKEVLAEQQIEAIAEPELRVTGYEPVTFQAVVPLPPRIILGDYKAIRVETEDVEPTTEAIDEQIERLRNQHATWGPVERPVQLGDSVTLDYKGALDGEPWDEKSDHPLTVTADNPEPVPGFAEQLVGAEVDQPKEIAISFPADYSDERLAGKTYQFTATVREVKARELPELDENFVQTLGEDLQTVDQLRERIRENLKAQAETQLRQSVEQQVLDRVAEVSEIEFPHVLVDQRIHQEMDRQARQMSQFGVTLEQWLKYRGQSVQQFHDSLAEPSRKLLRNDLITLEVAKAEGLTPADDEVDRLLDVALAQSPPEEIERLKRNETVRQTFTEMMMREKALHFLVSNATEGKVTYPTSLSQVLTAATEPAAAETDESVQPGATTEGTAATGTATDDVSSTEPARAEAITTSEPSDEPAAAAAQTDETTPGAADSAKPDGNEQEEADRTGA